MQYDLTSDFQRKAFLSKVDKYLERRAESICPIQEMDLSSGRLPLRWADKKHIWEDKP